jgi:16S rRNA (guanine527-N7)-methyltransferase
MELCEDEGLLLAEGFSSEVIDRFRVYYQLVRKWQKRINLVAPSTLNDFWRRHIFDSCQLLKFAGSWADWVDLGSGGGFPGMAIAVAIVGRGCEGNVHLIESDKRKAAFLHEVSRETGARVDIRVERIELALPILCKSTKIDIVSARALAPMRQLLSFAQPALDQGALGLFLKGKGLFHELTEVPVDISFDIKIAKSRSDSEGNIVLIRRSASGVSV